MTSTANDNVTSSSSTTSTTQQQNEPTDTREEWEIQRDAFKSKADAHYKAKHFREAIAAYTDAISVDDQSHILYSNRSAAYLSNNEKSKALRDAQKCVELKVDWHKGHNRLGSALFSLGRCNEARKAYMESLRLQPEGSNPVASKGLADVRAFEQRRVEQERRQREAVVMEASACDDDDGADDVSVKEKKECASMNVSLASPKDEGDDLLGDFFTSVDDKKLKEEEKLKREEIPDVVEADSSKIKKENADLGTAKDQINRLILTSNHQWKNLNPFYVLDISHTASEDEVARRYKALSLLLHPDKCKKERARDAFEEVRKANSQLSDESKRKHVCDLIKTAMKKGQKEFDQERKRKNAVGLKMEENLESFQRKKVMKVFADIELKRREIEQRKRKHEQREREQEDAEAEKLKKEHEFEMNWKSGNRLNNRMGNWRDFQGKGKRRK